MSWLGEFFPVLSEANLKSDPALLFRPQNAYKHTDPELCPGLSDDNGLC